MSEQVYQKKSKRIFYFDALRALAIISVIIYHVFKRVAFATYLDYSMIPTLNWVFTDIMGTCFRCGVDIFLMLSGALSLGRVWDIKSFLAKRIPRITAPFLFWGFILALFLVLIPFISPEFNSMLSAYNFNIPHPINMGIFLQFLVDSYLALNRWFGTYWFFWMILGTYLIMPILNKWLLHADLKEAEYFLVIWLITCLFDYTLMVEFPIKLTYFTGPIGMVVLGYYLRHTKRGIFNNLHWGILMMIFGACALVFVSYLYSSTTNFYVFHRYSILLAIEVIGIFVTFKNFNQLGFNFKGKNIFKKGLSSIAKYSYGIYLIHQVFMNLFVVILIQFMHYRMLVISLLLSTLLVSWLVMSLLNRIPYVNQIIGAK